MEQKCGLVDVNHLELTNLPLMDLHLCSCSPQSCLTRVAKTHAGSKQGAARSVDLKGLRPREFGAGEGLQKVVVHFLIEYTAF